MLAIADVAVTVKDARASAQWWQDRLGFSVHTVGPPEGHAVMVAPPGERFLLHLCQGFAAVEPGNSGIAFVTDEIESVVARLESAGVEFVEPLTKNAWGGSAKFNDADGNTFWLLGAPTSFIRTQTRRRAPAAPVPATRAPSRPARRATARPTRPPAPSRSPRRSTGQGGSSR